EHRARRPCLEDIAPSGWCALAARYSLGACRRTRGPSRRASPLLARQIIAVRLRYEDTRESTYPSPTVVAAPLLSISSNRRYTGRVPLWHTRAAPDSAATSDG